MHCLLNVNKSEGQKAFLRQLSHRHVRLSALLGLVTDQNDKSPYHFIYFN